MLKSRSAPGVRRFRIAVGVQLIGYVRSSEADLA